MRRKIIDVVGAILVGCVAACLTAANVAAGDSLWTYRPGGFEEEVISPDGEWIVTISCPELDFEGVELRQFHLWDTTTGLKSHQWEDTFAPQGLAITDDGQLLVSVGFSKEKAVARAWDLPKGKQRFSTTVEGFRPSRNLTVVSDRSKAYLMSAGYGYYAIDLESGRITVLLKGGWGDAYVAPRSGLVIDPHLEGLDILKSPEDFAKHAEPLVTAAALPNSVDQAMTGDGRFFAATYEKQSDRGSVQMIAVYSLAEKKKRVLNMSCELPAGISYNQLVISNDGRYAVIAKPHWSGRHTPFLLDLQAEKGVAFTAVGGDQGLVGFTPAGILITRQFGMYHYYDPKTQTRLKPPLSAKHFQINQ